MRRARVREYSFSGSEKIKIKKRKFSVILCESARFDISLNFGLKNVRKLSGMQLLDNPNMWCFAQFGTIRTN